MINKFRILGSIVLVFAFFNACKTTKEGAKKTDCLGEKDSTMNCIMLYKPDCGCDGVTYSNSCVANRNGILKFTEGECK